MKAQLTETQYRVLPELKLALPSSERRMLLFAGDLLALFVVSVLALQVQTFFNQAVLVGWEPGGNDALWLLPLAIGWVIVAGISECYEPQVAFHRLSSVVRIVTSTFVTALLYILIYFVIGRPAVLMSSIVTSDLDISAPPRVLALLFFALALVLVPIWRVGYARLFSNDALRPRALILGAGGAGRSLVRALRQAASDYEIVGYIDDDAAKQGQQFEGLAVLGTRRELAQRVRALRVSEIVVAITHEMDGELVQALMECYEQQVSIKPMAMLYEERLGQVPVEHLGTKWLPAPFWSSAVLPTFYRVAKRLLDVSLALLGLACVLPLFPIVALAIYLDCPGPIFYLQERLGRGGKPFQVMKFRSMVPNAERNGQAVWATRGDQRITRIGKWMRRTRIDELPQLLNVLRGDMSFVGPRPERAQFVSQLHEQIPFFRARLSVKPGLTGWAQINYGYGNSVEDARMKLQYDLYYIKHRSISLDLLVLFRTIMVVLAFKGT